MLDASATPELQGQYLARQWLTNLSNEIPISIWYDWHDDGTNPKDPEAHFGTVANKYYDGRDPVYDAKPAYLAARAFNTTLGSFHFSKRILVGDPTDHVLLFDKNGQTGMAVWTEGGPHELKIPTSRGAFNVTSHLGEAMAPLTADASGLAVQLSDGPQYLIAQQPNDFLSLLAAWDTLPLETLVPHAGDAAVASTLHNPTASPIKGSTSGGQQFEIPPGQSQTITITKPVKIDAPEPVRVELTIDGNGTMAQETSLQLVNPVVATIGPVGDHAIIATLRNPRQVSFTGVANVTIAGEGKTVSGHAAVELKPGVAEQSITVTTTDPLPTTGSIELLLVDASNAEFAGFGSRYSSAPAAGLGSDGFALWPMKNQSLTAAAAPDAPPTLAGPVMKLDYAFTGPPPKASTQPAAPPAATQPAVLTLALSPKPKRDELVALEGQPSRLTFWLYGDASGNTIGARIVDAAGQTFQPSFGPITWAGLAAGEHPSRRPGRLALRRPEGRCGPLSGEAEHAAAVRRREENDRQRHDLFRLADVDLGVTSGPLSQSIG